MKFRFIFAISIVCGGVSAADQPAQRALTIPDIVAWKHIQSPSVSHNGEWFGYRLAPSEGDGEVVLRNLQSGKELRFPAGDPSAAAPAGGGGAAVAPVGGGSSDPEISADGKWAVFRAYPTTQAAKRLKRERRPIQTKAVLVELATGKKTEIEKVRRFAFNGELSTHLVLQRYAASDGAPAAPAGGAGASAAGAGSGGGAAAPQRPTGSDVLLMELATGAELNMGNVSDFAFDKKGAWMAYLIDATDKAGNGIELRNMSTGVTVPLDNAEANYRGLNWTEKGDGLSTLRGADDKGFEDKLYTLVAFKDFGEKGPATKVVFDPKSDTSFPAGMTISPGRPAVWREDLSAVTFGIHAVKAKKKGAAAENAAGSDDSARPATPPQDQPDLPDLVIWHYKDPRLQTQQEVQEASDKNFSYLAVYVPSSKKFIRLADDTVRTVTFGPQAKLAMGVDIRDYEREGNLSGRRYEDVYVIDAATGQRKAGLKKAEHVMGESPDGTKLLYFADGEFLVYDMETGKSTDLTSKLPVKFWDTEDDHNVVKPPRQSLGWTKDNSAVLLSDGWDVWRVPVAGGAAENLTVNGDKEKIRYRRIFRLDPDERGVDLSHPVYVSAYGEWTKKGGIGLIEPGKHGVQMLQWGDAAYLQLLKAKSADVYLYTRENTQEFPNYYASNASLTNGKQVTDANPQQKNLLWSAGVKLIDYASTRGEKLQAALFLPANYQPGKHYPTIVYIYEKLSQNANAYPQPGYNGFNVAHYTSNGYAVLEPDIVYKVNDPGMSAVACVVPAVKAAIATGIVDAAAVGLQGHSWGGYQTAFLVTQTDIFHAAIAGAPLTDMVSMYSLIYRNTGGTNQAIFESSQGRFAGGYWDNMEAYVRNSPVYHAKNVKTPLIILANDKDGAVDQTQGIAYFNTLRRLNKPVILLEYKGENHNLRVPKNMKDYTARMREWFDHYLKDKPSPKWMEEGVPWLEIKDHLEPRVTELEKPADAKPAAATTGGGGNGQR
ncbi:MAG TPA: prolyl oligopeptidase family serine peptidase [Bryobacteraceae bacterium]|nr:prolyl oligopeptidase family serine peptidase [Bryobacteraceae bacterium]